MMGEPAFMLHTRRRRALNEVYHKVLTELSPADAARLRSDEVAWIKKRDKVTDEFAEQALHQTRHCGGFKPPLF